MVQREALREDGNDGQDFGKQCFPGPIDYGRPRVARHIAKRISDHANEVDEQLPWRAIGIVRGRRFGMLAKEMFTDERCQIVAARCRKLEVLLDRMGRALICPASVRFAKKSGALAPLKNCVDPIIPDV